MKTASSGLAVLALMACLAPAPAGAAEKGRVPEKVQGEDTTRVVRTNAEWKKLLSPEAYFILREQGTEIAFTGKYWNNHASGVYRCAACGNLLFRSSDKFESGTGWPSFVRPAFEYSLVTTTDTSLGETRDELVCRRCGGHLGHVFDDGPPPTGMRYCIDSGALRFVPSKSSR